jgi:hypothetical protein
MGLADHAGCRLEVDGCGKSAKIEIVAARETMQ